MTKAGDVLDPARCAADILGLAAVDALIRGEQVVPSRSVEERVSSISLLAASLQPEGGPTPVRRASPGRSPRACGREE